ncbi:MAG: iron ABC transporter permease [Chloroflexi bacterium]|nr:iron ABC transporter permease [Chloroflexota bacterium]
MKPEMTSGKSDVINANGFSGQAITPAHRPTQRVLVQSLLLWLFPGAFFLFFYFYPLGAVFHESWQAASDTAMNWNRVIQPLGFTLWQAALSTVLTLSIGLPAAYLFTRFDFPLKSILRGLTTLPFILPTVVAAAAINALYGPRGWFNLIWMALAHTSIPPINIVNTLQAILLAHVFYNTAVVIRVTGSAWEKLDTRLPDAARMLGASPWIAFREITLPLLMPSILASAVLVFLFDFTSFGVILMLGGPGFSTLETEVYYQAMQRLNLPMASIISILQLLCTVLIGVAYTRVNRQVQIPLVPRIREASHNRAANWRQNLVLALLVAGLVVLFVLPLASLAARSVTRLEAERGQRSAVNSGLTIDYYRELFINRRQSIFYVPPVKAAVNSLVYAGETVLIAGSLGLMASLALKRKNLFTRVMDGLLMLPLGTSAVTLGLGYILVFNRPPLDIRSFPLFIPIAHSLVALPFVIRTIAPALESIPESLHQAAATLGASPARVWLEVDWPIIARSALVSAIFSFTISLGEFGATSFLSRPEVPTLPVAIYRFLSQPGALNYGQAMAMATFLMIVCLTGILLMEKWKVFSFDQS